MVVENSSDHEDDDHRRQPEIDKLVSLGTTDVRDQMITMKDPCFTIHLLFLMFGIIYLIPANFFVTANGYWKHKFRDTSMENSTSIDGSILQKNFASGSVMASTIPTIIFMILTTIFGYKIRVRTRLYITLYVLFGSLAVSTGIIKIDTDYWQGGFFAFTMFTLVILNGATAVFQVTSLVLVSKFPARFMKLFLVGQGVGGIFSSTLEVVAVTIGSSDESAALIYFTVGTVLMFFTLALFYFSEKSNFYQYYIDHSVEDTKKDLITYEEVRKISSKIWSSLVIVMAGALAYVPTHPAVAALVQPEGTEDTLWRVTYFVPTITFLFSDICSAIGRVISAAFPKTISDSWLATISVARMVIFVPLFMFCNAQPRRNLPVWFPHDWQYIIILGSFMISSGYLFNIAFLNITRLAPKEEETAYMLMQTFIGIMGAVFSPLGVLCVNLL